MTSPLRGKRILIARPAHQAGGLQAVLEQKGAATVCLPVIEIVDPEDYGPLDDALKELACFQWIIFTSVNAVERFRRRFSALGLAMPETCRVGVVGPKSAAAAQMSFGCVDAMPEKFMAAEIASEIGDIEGARILLPRGNLASDELPVELRKRGATVTEVVAYRTVRKSDLTKPNPYEPPDAITFTSGEAARASIEFLLASGAGDWLEKCPILCIGPATAKAVIQCGHRVAAVAEKHDSEGLVEALEEWFVGALERQAYAK